MDSGLRLQCRPTVSQKEMAVLEVVPQTVVNEITRSVKPLGRIKETLWCVKNWLTTLIIP